MNEDMMDSLVALLKNDKFKKQLVKKLNANVDIPFINEKTEKKIIEALYETVLESVKSM